MYLDLLLRMLHRDMITLLLQSAEQLQRYFSAIDADAPLDKWTAPDFAGREHEIN